MNNQNFKGRKKVFINGKIFTVDELNPLAEAVVINESRIIYAGDNKSAQAMIDSETKVIDLEGNLMLPGFIDNHTHFIDGGFYLLELDLQTAKSTSDFKQILRKYVEKNKGKWITGGNWNHEEWETKQLPSKEMIDYFTDGTPVFIERLDKHIALANSYALKLAGITKDTPCPEGGSILKDSITGEPTGILKDNAMPLVYSVIPKRNELEIKDAALAALNEAKKNGVTGIHDITMPEHLPVYRNLLQENKLSCRIFSRMPLKDYHHFNTQKIQHELDPAKLKTGSVKAFADGSLGAGTAWFFEPYLNEENNYGLPMDVVTNGNLEKWSIEADKNKLQLSIHAIGDRANSFVLDLFEKITNTNQRWDRRFRIEHAQHLREHDIKRFPELGVIASVQPHHLIDDGSWAEKKIGSKRLNGTYPFKSLLDEKAKLCFGSDWPVAPLKPLMGIYAAVTRSTLDGSHPDGWIPGQKISVEDAIKCYTINNAYASFEENEKGSITPGKLADFVVLDKDILKMDPQEIKTTKVIMTVFDGEIIFNL